MINYGNKGEFKPQQSTSFETIPAGAYVGKILGAKVENVEMGGAPAQRLIIQMDVTEGEYKDHYQNQFKNAQSAGGNFPAKFKGVLRLNIPRPGDQFEAGNRRALENAAWALEQSNSGYHWDWDETKLKGLNVGFSVRERDWLMEENGVVTGSGTTTEIARLESVSAVREEKVKPMRKKELSEANKAKLAAQSATQNGYVPAETDDELPF